MKIRQRQIRARHNFRIFSDNPNVSLGIVDFSLNNRCIDLKDDYHKKWMNMHADIFVEFNYWDTLAKTFIIPTTKKQFIHKNIFSIAPVRPIPVAMKEKSIFTGSYTEKPYRYQQNDLRQNIILRSGKSNADFDAADNSLRYANESNKISRWYLLNSNWNFQSPLCTSVWFDFMARCYWKYSIPRVV